LRVQIEDVNLWKIVCGLKAFNGAAQFSRGEGITYGNGEVLYLYRMAAYWKGSGLALHSAKALAGGTIELFVEPNEQAS